MFKKKDKWDDQTRKIRFYRSCFTRKGKRADQCSA